MDAILYNQFITAADTIFKKVANLSLSKQDLKLFPMGSKFHANLATIIGITGALRGQLVLIIDEEMAKKIASAILMGMPVEEFNELAESGVCEMANMISGEASRLLLEKGFSCELSVPSIIRGRDIEIGFSPKSPAVSIQFSCAWGPVELVIQIGPAK